MNKLSIDQYMKRLKIRTVIHAMLGIVVYIFIIYTKQSLFWVWISVWFLLDSFSFSTTNFQIKKLLSNPIVQQELRNNIIFYSSGYIVTESYVISIGIFKSDIIAYSDVVLIYLSRRRKQMGRSVYLNLILHTGEKYQFTVEDSCYPVNFDNKYQDFTDVILKKNPNVLVGKTDENMKILREKYHITKKLKS